MKHQNKSQFKPQTITLLLLILFCFIYYNLALADEYGPVDDAGYYESGGAYESGASYGDYSTSYGSYEPPTGAYTPIPDNYYNPGFDYQGFVNTVQSYNYSAPNFNYTAFVNDVGSYGMPAGYVYTPPSGYYTPPSYTYAPLTLNNSVSFSPQLHFNSYVSPNLNISMPKVNSVTQQAFQPSLNFEPVLALNIEPSKPISEKQIFTSEISTHNLRVATYKPTYVSVDPDFSSTKELRMQTMELINVASVEKLNHHESPGIVRNRRQLVFSPAINAQKGQGDGVAWVISSKGQPQLAVKDDVTYKFDWNKNLGGNQRLTLTAISPAGEQIIKNYTAAFDKNDLLQEVRIPGETLSNSVYEVVALAMPLTPEREKQKQAFGMMLSDQNLLKEYKKMHTTMNEFLPKNIEEQALNSIPPKTFSSVTDLISANLGVVEYGDNKVALPSGEVVETDNIVNVTSSDGRTAHSYHLSDNGKLKWVGSSIKGSQNEKRIELNPDNREKVILSIAGEQEVDITYILSDKGLYEPIRYEEGTPMEVVRDTATGKTVYYSPGESSISGALFKLDYFDLKTASQNYRVASVRNEKDNSLTYELSKTVLLKGECYREKAKYDAKGNKLGESRRAKVSHYGRVISDIPYESNMADSDLAISSRKLSAPVVLTVPPSRQAEVNKVSQYTFSPDIRESNLGSFNNAKQYAYNNFPSVMTDVPVSPAVEEKSGVKETSLGSIGSPKRKFYTPEAEVSVESIIAKMPVINSEPVFTAEKQVLNPETNTPNIAHEPNYTPTYTYSEPDFNTTKTKAVADINSSLPYSTPNFYEPAVLTASLPKTFDSSPFLTGQQTAQLTPDIPGAVITDTDLISKTNRLSQVEPLVYSGNKIIGINSYDKYINTWDKAGPPIPMDIYYKDIDPDKLLDMYDEAFENAAGNETAQHELNTQIEKVILEIEAIEALTGIDVKSAAIVAGGEIKATALKNNLISLSEKPGASNLSALATQALGKLESTNAATPNLSKILTSVRKHQGNLFDKMDAMKELSSLDVMDLYKAAVSINPDITTSDRNTIFSILNRDFDDTIDTDSERDEVIDIFVKGLEKFKDDTRISIVLKVGEFISNKTNKNEEDISPLIKVITTENPSGPSAAMVALIDIGIKSPEVIAVIKSAVKSSDKSLRNNAISAAGFFKIQELEKDFILLLSDNDPGVRFKAAIALARMGSKEALPKILKLASTERIVDVRDYMRFAASYYPWRETKQVILEGLSSHNCYGCQRNAIKSMENYALANDAVKVEVNEIVTALEKANKYDEEPYVRADAGKALKSIRAKSKFNIH